MAAKLAASQKGLSSVNKLRAKVRKRKKGREGGTDREKEEKLEGRRQQ
jgi:hypothetical protein